VKQGCDFFPYLSTIVFPSRILCLCLVRNSFVVYLVPVYVGLVSSDWMTVKNEFDRCGMKWSWPALRQYSGRFHERLNHT
jgi:hypothetical protein